MTSTLTDLEMQPREEVRTVQGYSLDAVVCVDGRDVAVEVDGPSHLVGHSPTGATALKRRQLRAAGWPLLAVPYWEWVALNGAGRREYMLRGLAEAAATVGAGGDGGAEEVTAAEKTAKKKAKKMAKKKADKEAKVENMPLPATQVERADREAQAQAEASAEAAAEAGAAAEAAALVAKVYAVQPGDVIEVTNAIRPIGKVGSGEAGVVGKGKVQQGDIGGASHSALHYIAIAASVAVVFGIALYDGWR